MSMFGNYILISLVWCASSKLQAMKWSRFCLKICESTIGLTVAKVLLHQEATLLGMRSWVALIIFKREGTNNSWKHKSRKYTGILIRTIIGLVRQNLNNWVQTIFYQSLLPKCRNQSLWPLLNCALKVCKSLFGSKLLTEVDSNKFNSIFSSWGFHWKK